MRFRVMSDLHFEFHADGGREFVKSLDAEPDEVLLCAGDVCSAPRLTAALMMLCRRFSRVVYVVGNHEFYGADPGATWSAIGMVLANFPQTFHPLDKEVLEIDGVRILGCPLWFPRNDHAPKHAMNDFRLIGRFEEWVYDENAKCIEFLCRETRASDVVLTHYLPSRHSIAPRWRGSPLNAFFLCDVTPLIQDVQPALWVHGHTHDSIDYRIGATRVLCNPFGYADHEENASFDPLLRVDIHGANTPRSPSSVPR